jgi:hypothetical protein
MSPAQQSIVDLAETLGQVDGTTKVDITLSELEKNVEDFKVTIEGESLDYEKIRDAIRDFGAVIRNVDNIVSAKECEVNNDHDKLSASMLVLAQHVDSNIAEQKQINDEFDSVLSYIKSLKK